jgi:type I restriction enzyme, S subunit
MKSEQYSLKPLSELCEFRRGLTYKKGDQVELSSTPVLRATNISLDSNELILDDLRYISDEFVVPENKMVIPESILMCISSGSKKHLGKVAFIEDIEPLAFGGFMGLLVPKSEIYPKYLYYSLISPMFRDWIAKLSDGTNINNLNFSKIENFQIRLPPFDQQKRIARMLDEASANIYDSLAESRRRSQSGKEFYDSCADLAVNGKLVPQDQNEESGAQLLEHIIQQRETLWNLAEDEKMAVAPNRARRSKYKKARPIIIDKLPEIPSNWVWASLDELSYFVIDYRGKTPPTSGTGIPIISAANVREGFVDLSPPRFVSEETYNLWSVRGEPKAGDILITTEAPVGRTAIYPENTKYLLTRRILGARLNERCNPEYIRLCLSAGFTAKRIAWHSHGATVPRILKPNLFSVPIPFPPFEEQNRIMQHMREVSQLVNSMENKCRVKIESLDEFKQSILQEAFNGNMTKEITA